MYASGFGSGIFLRNEQVRPGRQNGDTCRTVVIVVVALVIATNFQYKASVLLAPIYIR